MGVFGMGFREIILPTRVREGAISVEDESGLRVVRLSFQLKASVWVMNSSMSHNCCCMMEVCKGGVGRKW